MKGLLIGLVALLLLSCNGNKGLETDLWFEQVETEAVLKHEKANGGIEHEASVVKNAKVFMRNVEGELPLKVRYYFSEEGKVKKVMYEWSKVIPNLTPQQLDSIMIEEANNIGSYHEKFERVAEVLTTQLGLPTSGDGHLVKERFEMLDMWKRNYAWKKENQHTKLNLVWVPKLGYRIFKVYVETTWE